MTTPAGDICAQCTHFKMKGYPEHARVAWAGAWATTPPSPR